MWLTVNVGIVPFLIGHFFFVIVSSLVSLYVYYAATVHSTAVEPWRTTPRPTTPHPSSTKPNTKGILLLGATHIRTCYALWLLLLPVPIESATYGHPKTWKQLHRRTPPTKQQILWQRICSFGLGNRFPRSNNSTNQDSSRTEHSHLFCL